MAEADADATAGLAAKAQADRRRGVAVSVSKINGRYLGLPEVCCIVCKGLCSDAAYYCNCTVRSWMSAHPEVQASGFCLALVTRGPRSAS